MKKAIVIFIIFTWMFSPDKYLTGQYILKSGAFGNGSASLTDNSGEVIFCSVGLPLTGNSSGDQYTMNSGFWNSGSAFFVGIADEPLNIPDNFKLHQNYPNPFNPSTCIEYDLPEALHVRIDIYNLLGQRVTTLVDEAKQAGYQKVQWDGRHLYGENVSSGMYFYIIQAGPYRQVKKMILVK